MADFHPPERFVQRLREYDPLLRVRWSNYKKCWLLERKIRHGRPGYGDSPNPDVNQRFHDGYIHVFSVPHYALDNRVFLALGEGDMWRQGGAKSLNQQMDSFNEETENRSARKQRDDLKQIGGDMWDYMARLRKSRINMHVNPLSPNHINRGT